MAEKFGKFVTPLTAKLKRLLLELIQLLLLQKHERYVMNIKAKSFEGIDPIDERKKAKKIIAEKEAVESSFVRRTIS